MPTCALSLFISETDVEHGFLRHINVFSMDLSFRVLGANPFYVMATLIGEWRLKHVMVPIKRAD